MSTGNDLQLSVIVKMIDETSSASKAAVENIKSIELAATTVSKTIKHDMVGSLGGFKEVTELTRKHFKDVIDLTGGAKTIHAGAMQAMREASKSTGDAIETTSSLSKLHAIEARYGIEQATDAAKKSGKELIENAETVGAGIGKAMLVAGGVFAAKGIFDFVSNSITKTLDLADSFAALEKQTGLSTKMLAGLKFAAEQSDTSLQALSIGAMNLERTIGAGGKAAEKLKQMGIDSRDPMTALLQASEAIARAKDPMEQATIAQLAFKNSWRELLPLMKEGSVAIGEMMDAGVKYYGKAAEMAATADKLRDSQAELQASLDSLSFTVAVKFIPDLEEITSASALAAREEGLAMAFIVMLGGVMKKTWDAIKLGWDALAWALQQAVETAFLWPLKKTQEFTDAASKWAGEVGDAILAKAGEWAGLATAWVDDAIKAVQAKASEWYDAGGKMIDRWKDGIAANLRGELGIGKKIAESIEYVKNTGKQWADAGMNIMQGLLDGIKNKYKEIVDKLRNLGGDMLRAVKDVLDIRSPSGEFEALGEFVAQGFMIGVEKGTPKVKAAVKKMVEIDGMDKLMPDSASLRTKATKAIMFDDIHKKNRKIEAEERADSYRIEAGAIDEWANANARASDRIDALIDRLEPAGLATRKFADDMDALTAAAINGNISLDRYANLTEQLATGESQVTAATKTNKDSKRDEIASKYASGQSISSLAKEYGMSEAALKSLIARTSEADTAFGKLQSAAERVFGGMEDAIVNFVKTGKLDFSSLADSMISDLIRIQVQEMMTNSLKPMMNSAMSAIGSFFGFAQGGTPGGTSAWRNQIVDKPTLFAFAKGGVMGEAGPEAIMPLARGPDGNLGVRASGGNVTVNVINNAQGTQATARESTDGNGNRMIEVFIEQVKGAIAGDISRGSGAVPDAMASTYGLNRVAGAY
jgi:lambda family phage tail tape measure protein